MYRVVNKTVVGLTNFTPKTVTNAFVRVPIATRIHEQSDPSTFTSLYFII